MKKIIPLIAGALILIFPVTSLKGQAVKNKRIIRVQHVDSLDRAFLKANHALREIGFKVIQTNRRKTTVTLERDIGSWLYQTLLRRKNNEVDIEIFFFTGPTFRLSWTYPEKQQGNIETIFSVIDFRLKNGEPLPQILLSNSILWGIKIDDDPPELALNN